MQLKATKPTFGYLGLLISLAFVFLVSPFLHDNPITRIAVNVSMFGLLVFSVYAISTNARILIISIVLAIPSVLAFMVQLPTDLNFISLLFNVVFFGFVMTIMLRGLFASTVVDANTIYGAVCIYVLIGLECGLFFTLLEIYSPNSFQFGELSSTLPGCIDCMGDLIYYSFVTLTTLGYGDITPISNQAKSLSSFEAMMGQIFLTVLVARLVGMHIAQWRSRKK